MVNPASREEVTESDFEHTTSTMSNNKDLSRQDWLVIALSVVLVWSLGYGYWLPLERLPSTGRTTQGALTKGYMSSTVPEYYV